MPEKASPAKGSSMVDLQEASTTSYQDTLEENELHEDGRWTEISHKGAGVARRKHIDGKCQHAYLVPRKCLKG